MEVTESCAYLQRRRRNIEACSLLSVSDLGCVRSIDHRAVTDTERTGGESRSTDRFNTGNADAGGLSPTRNRLPWGKPLTGVLNAIWLQRSGETVGRTAFGTARVCGTHSPLHRCWKHCKPGGRCVLGCAGGALSGRGRETDAGGQLFPSVIRRRCSRIRFRKPDQLFADSGERRCERISL